MSFLALLAVVASTSVPVAAAEPKNVILFIGDGMGLEHVKATGMYLYGAEYGKGNRLVFEKFPNRGELKTSAAGGVVTDSAAAGTAIATGFKVNNGIISIALPANKIHGKGREMETMLEYFKKRGKSTGLVSSKTITDATPAAFGAHDPSRGNRAGIADDYLTQTRPNVLFGGGGAGMTSEAARAAGYIVVTDRAAMLALKPETSKMVSGQFGTGNMPFEADGPYDKLPHLSEMTAVALKLLSTDRDGFFVMIESAQIDSAAHLRDIRRTVLETVEFAKAVQVAVKWAKRRKDTLIIVTADHETGGLKVVKNNGKGKFPTVTWATGGHMPTNVPIYAWGAAAKRVSGVMDNTDVFRIATGRNPAALRKPKAKQTKRKAA
ncbi:MAG: alkaline phosphatase [Planctomycetia bacterium]|nr:alkaline phosphatase [Planctomycetia bacterium]